MLTIENLDFAYGNVQTLFGLNLTVPKGKVTSVTGRNGVGKTTLMKNITGLLKPIGGSLEFKDEIITTTPPHKRVGKGIAYVPQGRQIFPRLTVEENLRTGLKKRSDGIPEEVYDFFPVLKEMRARMGGDLSGGQQQQLAIARALVTGPELLILDEPTEGIQPNIIQKIGEVLQELCHKRGMTILIVEQYLDFIKEFSDYFAIMNRGSVVANGEITELSEELIVKYLHV